MNSKQDILILKASAMSISYFVHEVCKAEPSEQQQAVLNAIDRGERKISVRSGHGCHGIDTPIMMLDGSSRKVQDIRVGDKLMGDDGKSERNVLSLARGQEELFEFTYSSGIKRVYNKSHILCLYDQRKMGNIIITVEDFIKDTKAMTDDEYFYDYNGYQLTQIGSNLCRNIRIEEITPLGLGDYYGFELDGNNLFLDGDLIVHHNTGKTAMLSWIVIWWGLFKEDAKIPMTAPTSHQLFDLLLPEIRKWRDRLPDVLKAEFEVGAERVIFNNENFAVARTARKEQPEALQGFHAGALAFIIDEASGIPQIIFEVAEGAMTGDDVLVLMTANPTRTEGYFYDSHNKNRWQWSCFQFNAETSPNVSKKWVDEKKRQYGEDSDTYRIRVRGDFPLKSSNSILSLAEVEDAVNATVWDDTGVEVWGVDVADFGDDKTVLAKRRNKYFYPLKTKSGLDLTEIAGWLVKEYRDSIIKPYAIFVDAIGVGSSLAPICHQLGLDCVIPVKASNRASDDEKYHNRRAEWYFRLKEILLDGKLPDDDELVGELMAQKYKISQQGKLIIVPKDEIKKELGRSPDKADACSLTCHDILYGFVQEDEYIEAEIVHTNNYFGANGGVW